MRSRTRLSGRSAGARLFMTVAVLAVLLTGCKTTMRAGDAGCSAYAEARLGYPASATVAGVPSDWAGWIADLDDRMTGTCR